MTGVAAFALSIAFTSCSHDFEVMTQSEIDQATYKQAFLNYVGGSIAADQDWGFGSSSQARTRATRATINVNGNMWDTCPDVDAPDEVNAIFDYVKYPTTTTKVGVQTMSDVSHNYSTKAPQNINGYFVTHVRNGKNDDNKYTYFNGQSNTTVTDVGGYMNHLQIAMNANPSLSDLNGATESNQYSASGWQHINNFNASYSNDYKGNTKVENGGAYDFAYHNSKDSKYHNKWILIDGADITSDGKYSNYYYVCFDFESTPACTTRFRFKYNGTEYGPVDVAGFWTVSDAIANHLEATINGATQVDLSTVENLRIDNIQEGDKNIPGDNVYTDWIIRITKGAPSQEDVVYDLRIIAEDLCATEAGDFDFNDVVFDVKYDASNAYIKLLAAGGTLKLRLDGKDEWEVHKLFNVQQSYMVNTNARAKGLNGNNRDMTPVKFRLGRGIADAAEANGIKIEVFKNNEWQELTAERGEPASKLAVGTNYYWLDERTSIKETYEKFTDWATNNNFSSEWWR